MLRLIEEKDAYFSPLSPMSIRIEALMNTYGFNTSFAYFWQQESGGEVTALVSKVDGDVTIAAKENFNAEEMKEFLSVIGFSSLLAESKISEALGFKEGEKGFIMERETVGKKDEASVCYEPPYRKIYELLKKPENFGDNIPPYGDWLADLSARVRKNSAGLKWISENEACVSSAMLTFKTEKGAVLGAVATDEKFRGRGYAKFLVNSLCESIGKNVFLLCKEDKINFYKKMNFKISGEFSLVSGVHNE